MIFERESNPPKVPTRVFWLLGILLIIDITLDLTIGGETLEALFELGTGILVGYAVFYFWNKWKIEREESISLRSAWRNVQSDAVRWKLEAERWRDEARTFLQGLGKVMDDQFTRWQFTLAEREVAMLILKGFSHKEIASVRNTSERTVRQQSLGIYGKAGIRNRAELSAFFLEDLLLPTDHENQREK
jgi:DNA-binding CsgD family transcriptional regulator